MSPDRNTRISIVGAAGAFCGVLSGLREPQTLEQAWTQAYQNNPSLEAQRAALRATDEQVSQTLSHWRPSIDANASIGKTWQYAPDLAPFENPSFNDTTHGGDRRDQTGSRHIIDYLLSPLLRHKQQAMREQ